MRLVIYHSPCSDGFGAAWAAYRALGREGVDYFGAKYGDAVPSGIAGGKYDKVYILDFSYPRALLEEMALQVGEDNVLVLDHHKTAKKELEGLPYARFSEVHSGSVMAWQYFHPDKPTPVLLKYIEDRDLWRFSLDNSREINSAISLRDLDFETWDKLSLDLEENPSPLIYEGQIICKTREKQIEAILSSCINGSIDGHRCIICPVPHNLASDALHLAISRTEGAIHIAIGYWDDLGTGHRTFSIRGDGAIDVSEIARKRGGGGHRNASGWREKIPSEFLIERKH